MRLLRRLFTFGRSAPRRAPASTPAAAARWTRVTDNFVEVAALGFFGEFHVSPNGRFLLAWSDAGPDGAASGGRSSGEGRYLLFDGQALLVEGRMPRPNDGKVADTGVFILNDWTFSSGLSGVFHAFRPDGAPILTRRFSANLLNNGLAADGALAACQTCNSPDEADSSRLVLFDLVRGLETAPVVPESGWASTYAFPARSGTVLLCDLDQGRFAYGLDGAFIDRSVWIEARLARGDLFVIERLLREAEDGPTPETARRLGLAADRALANAASQDPRSRAWALKLRGICFGAEGEPVRALDCYDRALALDPKIGVKRRADRLRAAKA